MLAFAFLLPIIGFILQTYTRLYNSRFGVDVWTRLLETEHVRKAGHKIPGKISGQFIIEGYFDYPLLFPYLLSFINPKKLEKYQGLVAPFFDFLNNILLFFVAYYFTQSLFIALIAQLVYTFTPVIVLENSGLTPRSLGYLVFNLAFISSLIYNQTGDLFAFFGSILFTTLIFMTHRFATQSLLFLSLFFSFYLNTVWFIGVFLLGFLLITILTQGYYLRVLIGHLYNIYFWIPNRINRFAHQVRGLQHNNKKKDFVELVYTMLAKFAPFTMIGTNFWIVSGLIVVFYVFLPTFLAILPQPFPLYIELFGYWIVFFYLIGIPILMIPWFICIGEGYRYLEMAAIPASILSAWLLKELLSTPLAPYAVTVFVFLNVLNLVMILMVQKNIIKDRNRSITQDLENVFSFLNSQKKIYRILCIPHQNTTNLIYHTKHMVFVNADNSGLIPLSVVYPVIQGSLMDTIEKYNLNLILLKESFAKINELKLGNLKELYRSGDIVLLIV